MWQKVEKKNTPKGRKGTKCHLRVNAIGSSSTDRFLAELASVVERAATNLFFYKNFLSPATSKLYLTQLLSLFTLSITPSIPLSHSPILAPTLHSLLIQHTMAVQKLNKEIANHNYSKRAYKTEGYKSFEDFYPYYLSEHCNT